MLYGYMYILKFNSGSQDTDGLGWGEVAFEFVGLRLPLL